MWLGRSKYGICISSTSPYWMLKHTQWLMLSPVVYGKMLNKCLYPCMGILLTKLSAAKEIR